VPFTCILSTIHFPINLSEETDVPVGELSHDESIPETIREKVAIAKNAFSLTFLEPP
jgi:hypothetical protein